jgi:hypothetical protein
MRPPEHIRARRRRQAEWQACPHVQLSLCLKAQDSQTCSNRVQNLPTHPPIYQNRSPTAYSHISARLSACLPVCLPARLPACQPVCLSACLPVCPSVCLPACLPASPSVCLSVCLSVCPSARLSVCSSVRPSVCLPINLRGQPRWLDDACNVVIFVHHTQRHCRLRVLQPPRGGRQRCNAMPAFDGLAGQHHPDGHTDTQATKSSRNTDALPSAQSPGQATYHAGRQIQEACVTILTGRRMCCCDGSRHVRTCSMLGGGHSHAAVHVIHATRHSSTSSGPRRRLPSPQGAPIVPGNITPHGDLAPPARVLGTGHGRKIRRQQLHQGARQRHRLLDILSQKEFDKPGPCQHCRRTLERTARCSCASSRWFVCPSVLIQGRHTAGRPFACPLDCVAGRAT